SLDLRDGDGREIASVLAQPKRLAVLAYLALHDRQRFVGRDHLLAAFWPEHDEDRARGALNRAIYYLRHSLGSGVITGRGGDALGRERARFWCDAAELARAAAEGRHDRVLDLYRGDLLEGFQLSEAPEFGRWLDSKRDVLRSAACRSAWSLAEAADRAG